jgi:hypothetical protein
MNVTRDDDPEILGGVPTNHQQTTINPPVVSVKYIVFVGQIPRP